MKTKNSKVQEAFIEFLDAWASRDSQTLEKIRSFIDDSFTAFGTGEHEIFYNSEDMFEQISKEISQIPSALEHTEKWINVIELDARTSLLNSELKFTFELDGKTIEIGPLRMTVVWYKRNGHYKIVNFHVSIPDISSKAEVFPGSVEPKKYEEVSVVFTDFVGFTHIASSIPAKKLVDELNEIFMEFDEITAMTGLDKIKTIRDSYMAVAGLNDSNTNRAMQCVEWSNKVLNYLKKRNEHMGIKWEIRIGIHTGSVVGGIIGKVKKTLDLWGDTINIASKLEKQSLPNKINVSAYTYELIKDNYEGEYRGKIDIKGKGSIDMYFVR